MERIRVHTSKDWGKKLAITGAGLLSLSIVACSTGQDGSGNQAQGQARETLRPAACPAGFGETRGTVGKLTSTGLPDGEITDLQEFDRTAKASNVQGFYGEPQNTLYSGAPEHTSYWQVLKNGKKIPLQEGQANLCVDMSHLATLTVASSKISRPADENTKLVGLVSINGKESASVPHFIFVEDPSRQDVNGVSQGVFAKFEVYDPRSGENISPKVKPDEVESLKLRIQQVDKRTSLPVAGTQHVFNVSFAGQ